MKEHKKRVITIITFLCISTFFAVFSLIFSGAAHGLIVGDKETESAIGEIFGLIIIIPVSIIGVGIDIGFGIIETIMSSRLVKKVKCWQSILLLILSILTICAGFVCLILIFVGH